VLGENPVNYRREPVLRVEKLEGRTGCLGISQAETARSAGGMYQGKSSGKVQAPERGPVEVKVVAKASLTLAYLFALAF
jgi:hypothetical protein